MSRRVRAAIAPAGSFSFFLVAIVVATSCTSRSDDTGVVRSAATTPSFVQATYADPQSSPSSVSAAFTAAQTAGNLDVVIVGWSDSTTQVTSVTDSKGNAYQLAVGPTRLAGSASQSIYYAKNIAAAAAGANTVTVAFNAGAPFPDLRILEYGGMDPGTIVDVTAAATGNSATGNSGAVTTLNANDLLVGANYVATSSGTAGTNFTRRLFTSPDSDLVEDRVVTATGSYSATAALSPSGWWIMQMVAFRPPPAGPDTTPPTAPSNLTATTASGSQINLAWAAATDNVAVTNYLVESCQGTGCSSFAQIGTSTTLAFNSMGLTAGTSYSYRVRATDAAGNLGPYSSVASATTTAPDTTPPTAPANLTATVASNTQINLAWAAATDNVAVTNYLVESCQGASCTTFAQIGTSTTLTFNNTGLTAGTSYSYRVRATDAAGNLGSYSNVASATTTAPDTTPPTAPANLTATVASNMQINLGWAAASDNVAVTNYLIERCQGASCTTFAQIGTSTALTFNNTGLSAGTSYSYRVRATDAAGNLGAYSNVASATTTAPDTTPPTAPSNLTATATSSSQVSLTWTAATDNVGVTNYLVERCQGSGCTTFAQVAMSTTPSFGDTGLVAGTSYSYRVRATDAAGNLGSYSNTASATTQPAATNPVFVQVASSDPQSTPASVSATFAAAQGGGDLNVVIIGWSDTTANVTGVTDSKGNSYQLAVGPTKITGTATQSIYYAKNIVAAAAGANAVTVTFSPNAPFPDLRIAEYGGINTVSPVDVTAAATGTGTAANSGAVTTTNANDLLVAGNYVATNTSADGANFTRRVRTSPDSDLLEDRIVTATGSYSGTSTINPSGWWIMSMVAFKGASGGPDTQPPTAPTNLTATATSMSQINLAWTAASDNVGVTNYLIERCQGPGCSNFAQIATSATPAFSDTGLMTGTSYSYRVRATDGAGNLGGYSGTASATTVGPDVQPPTPPSNLNVTGVSNNQITLAWTAATDNVGVTGYIVERCDGTGCSAFAQIGSASSTGFTSSGLTAGQTYSYRVAATDAANNVGGYSNVATATTTVPDTTPPSPPSNLTATAVSGNQINLSWSAATDDTGVVGYLIERCLGSGCTDFNQVGLTTGTTYADSALSPATTYDYRVRATDAAMNVSGPSGAAEATTTLADTLAPTPPSNLVATTASTSQINLTWTAATDNVGVTSYLIERCQGVGCVSFVQIASTSGTTFNDTGLATASTFSYRVRAADAANNIGGYSNVAGASTPTPAIVAFVQANAADPQSSPTSVAVTFTGAQAAGDLNVVFVGWTNATSTITSVTDTKGNVYAPALSPTVLSGTATQAAYYAKNIGAAAAGANTVTVTFSAAAPFPDVRIAEYSGLDPANPLDVAAGATGNSANCTTSPVATTSTGDLLVASNYNSTSSSGAGFPYTQRLNTNPDFDVLEDSIASLPGNYSATIPLGSTGWWVIQMVAFHPAAAGSSDTTPPTVAINSPQPGAALSGSINVSATASDASAIGGVQLLVDGIPLGPPDTTAPYSLPLDTTLFANGTHSLQAYAWDQFFNVGNATPISVTFSNASPANPAADGVWTGLIPSPMISTATAVVPGGKILMWDGQTAGFDARVWDPMFNSFTSVAAPSNIFCSALEQMADGRILVVGGHIAGHVGITALNAFNPSTLTWTVLADMANPRWYPTVNALGDGRFIAVSGETACNDCLVATPEIYNPATNTWTQLTNSQFTFTYYPHVFSLPDGRVLVSSTIESPTASQVLDLGTGIWTPIGGPAVDGGGAAMYLPGKVLKVGKSADPDDPVVPSVTTAYVLDTTQASPTWRQVGSMAFPRNFHNVTVLPDGTVLVSGGGPTTAATDLPNAILHSEIWSPTTETFTTMGTSMHAPRLYHSSAQLMPDGRVLSSGGGRFNMVGEPTDQYSNEFFAPPYLFKGPRPVISSAPAQLPYGQTFTVTTPDAARIAKVSLIRFGAATHTFNMSQRFIPLSFTAGSGSLTVTAPVNGAMAAAGNYMLFIVDTNGVPSIAAAVRL